MDSVSNVLDEARDIMNEKSMTAGEGRITAEIVASGGVI